MATETYDESFSRWRQLRTAVENNADDLPHLAGHAQRLGELADEFETAVKEQAALTASKQEKSQQIARLVAAGRAAAAFVTAGVRDHYGKSAEKLAEFKVQPRRSRRARAAEPPAPEPAPPAAGTGPDTTT
jgi:hypothetical protein